MLLEALVACAGVTVRGVTISLDDSVRPNPRRDLKRHDRHRTPRGTVTCVAPRSFQGDGDARLRSLNFRRDGLRVLDRYARPPTRQRHGHRVRAHARASFDVRRLDGGFHVVVLEARSDARMLV
jgi:hypothetical protein